MIILLDGNVWEKLAESFLKGSPKSGTLILEKHLPDSQFLHWVKDIGEKRLLGMVELIFLNWTKIDEIRPPHVRAAGFPSKEILKRTFLMFSKDVSAITVAKMRIVEIERYWCPNPKCQSTNLDFLKKNIHGNQLPFLCFGCEEEFYTLDKDDGSPRVKNAKLEKRYCREEIKKIPADQQAVLAVVGENWFDTL